MHTYTNYKVTKAADPDELRQKVLHSLLEGWEPLGGVAVVAIGGDNYIYCQALIKSVKD